MLVFILVNQLSNSFLAQGQSRKTCNQHVIMNYMCSLL